ncbi:hypothetical protein RB195_020087 [Necator americanus]|uniref:Uncharacterized protein n=1 Tax=Necator americanus TaxID=51031 RepID=A0ABR1CH76_NECAM
MTIYTQNVRTLASETGNQDPMMQAKIKYDIIGLTETRLCHPLSVVYEIGDELFLGTCDCRGVGVLVNTNMAINTDSFEQLTTRIRDLYGWEDVAQHPLRESSTLTLQHQATKKSKLSIWTWRRSTEIIPFTKSWLVISTSKLAQEERRRNFTAGPLAYNGTTRKRGFPSSS